MQPKSFSLFDRLASAPRLALLAPAAVVLVGTTLAMAQGTGQSPQPTPETMTSAAPAGPSAFSPAQRKELEAIIKDILLNNPEIMLEAQIGARSQDGEDPKRAHGRCHQGQLGGALPAGRLTRRRQRQVAM